MPAGGILKTGTGRSHSTLFMAVSLPNGAQGAGEKSCNIDYWFHKKRNRHHLVWIIFYPL